MKKNIDYCYATYNEEIDKKFIFSDKESNDCFKLKSLSRRDMEEYGLTFADKDFEKREEIFQRLVDDSKSSIKKDQFEPMDALFIINGIIEFCKLSMEDVRNLA